MAQAWRSIGINTTMKEVIASSRSMTAAASADRNERPVYHRLPSQAVLGSASPEAETRWFSAVYANCLHVERTIRTMRR
jgi:hypothetical protein